MKKVCLKIESTNEFSINLIKKAIEENGFFDCKLRKCGDEILAIYSTKKEQTRVGEVFFNSNLFYTPEELSGLLNSSYYLVRINRIVEDEHPKFLFYEGELKLC